MFIQITPSRGRGREEPARAIYPTKTQQHVLVSFWGIRKIISKYIATSF